MTKTLPNVAGSSQVGAASPKIKRLFNEHVRIEQKARIGGLNLQCCDCAGKTVWEMAERAQADLAPEIRIDLPSPQVFARVLGLLCCIAALKHRPMLELELSAQDIADAIGYSKSTVEAALRWLGGDIIVYRGMPVARGLGIISRVRRKALAIVEGILTKVYRTTEMALTLMGRALVGLEELVERRNTPQKGPAPKKVMGKKEPRASAPPSARKYEPEQDVVSTREVGMAWLKKLSAGDFSQ